MWVAEDHEERLRHSCGHRIDECSDPTRTWFPQRQIDYAAMDLAAANWRYDSMHESKPFHDGTFPDDIEQWSSKRDLAHPYHYRDGVTIYVSATDDTPGDDFLSWSSEPKDGETDGDSP